MELHVLSAKNRQTSGKGAAGRTRLTGSVPAVLYGGGQEPASIEINTREFEKFLLRRSGEQAVVQLDVTDKPELSSPALLKTIQHHPVRGSLLHADFIRIRLDERIITLVPLELVGRPIGVVNDGGILDHHLRELEVECLALDIPESFQVDVSHLAVGENLHVSDITVPPNVTIVTDGERTIAGVLAPRVAEEKSSAAGEEGEEGEGGGE